MTCVGRLVPIESRASAIEGRYDFRHWRIIRYNPLIHIDTALYLPKSEEPPKNPSAQCAASSTFSRSIRST